MKKLTMIAVGILFSLTIFAQDNAQLGHDPEAKKILDKLSVATKAHKTIKIKFAYTLENKQADVEETYKGYAFLKGNKYKLILPGTDIFSDGTTVWTYLKDAEEMNISQPDEDDESVFNPAKLFTIYESGFKFKYVGDDASGKVKLQVVDLFPENPKKKKFTRVRMKIDPVKNEIHSIKTFGKDGNHYTIKISEFTTGKKLPEALFMFDKSKFPEDVEIIDLRDE